MLEKEFFLLGVILKSIVFNWYVNEKENKFSYKYKNNFKEVKLVGVREDLEF